VADRAPNPLEVEVLPATPEQQPILANLLELYAHDFSAFHQLALGQDGRFGYKELPLYWCDNDRHPLLIRVGGSLAGLAFVRRGSRTSGNSNVWDMAEFFVIRGYRRRGVGIYVAHQIWRRFPGPWEIRVMESNRPALRFWEQAVNSFAGGRFISSRFEENGEPWRLFSFDCPAA
jgi:predicted acetyltransferase